jgi:hypothetical protein
MDRGKVAALFLGGTFLLGWSHYHFLRAYNDMWLSKISGLAAVSVRLPLGLARVNP